MDWQALLRGAASNAALGEDDARPTTCGTRQPAACASGRTSRQSLRPSRASLNLRGNLSATSKKRYFEPEESPKRETHEETHRPCACGHFRKNCYHRVFCEACFQSRQSRCAAVAICANSRIQKMHSLIVNWLQERSPDATPAVYRILVSVQHTLGATYCRNNFAPAKAYTICDVSEHFH